MKKVLFVATVDSHILHFHIPYLKLFKENGYEVHVATNGNEKIPYCDKKYTIPIERSPYKLRNIKAIKQLKEIIDNEKYDIIHCHTPMGSVVTRLAARKARKKHHTRVIYTAHGFHFYKGAPLFNWMLFYPVEKYLAKYTDTLITINNEDYELAKKKFNRRCKDIQYVPGVGIDTKKFDVEMTENEKNELRKSLGLKKDDFVMICIGELNDNKNQIFQINAMRLLSQKYKNIKLLLVGNGVKRDFLEDKIEEYNLQNYVYLLGYRNDIPNLLKISNLVLSTSKREGLPVNILEAMYIGLPIIGSNCRGTRDLIRNGKNGYIINVINTNELIMKIEKIYKNKEKVKKIFKYNEKILNEYMLENIICTMNNIYNFNKKKIILHLLASNKYSGAENVVCMIIKKTENDYDTLYCSPNGAIKTKLDKKNIKYLPITKLSFKEINRQVKKYCPDIIHAHDLKASCYGALFSSKCEVISHIHGNNKIMNTINLRALLYNFLSKRFKKIIYVSKSSYDNYYFKKNIKNNYIILPNVIDKQEVSNKANMWICKKKYDLIFLGRLEYPKNPERLIEIIRLVFLKKCNLKVAIVGNGSEINKIKLIVKKYGLEKNVDFYGFMENPFPILSNSKIMIMTSIYEGTPMSSLEAQALGKPIVSTPVDGLKQIVKNNYNGFLSNDNLELASVIVEYLSNEKKYNEMVQNSLNFFSNYNDLNKYINIIKGIYM